MRKTELNRLPARPRATIAALVTALLLAVPMTTALAQEKGAAPAPSPAQPAPKPEQAQPAPVPGQTSVTIIRTEIYGHIDSSVKDFKKKAITEATVLSLVSTSSEPVPVGAKGMLILRVEDEPGKAPKWVEIAEVTLKKHDNGGKIKVTVVAMKPEGLPQKNGKPIDPFTKKTKIKLQFDRVG
jgi:hypothetical protein